jgi:Dyp-type peroxidase family
MDTATLEAGDIQGLLLSAYAHLDFATYLFLQVSDAEKGKQWLRTVIPDISTAAPWPQGADGKAIKPATQVNIALTIQGLAALGMQQDSLDSFSTEYIEGPTGTPRSSLLGDTEDSAPEHWELGGPSNQHVNILLMLFADTAQALKGLRDQYLGTLTQAGLTLTLAQEASRLPEKREHFGFRDGIAQPLVEGSRSAPVPGQEAIKPGEFILGYGNEYGLVSPMPTPDVLGRNGTYLVYRKLAQNVAAYQQFLSDKAGGDPAQMNMLGAKMLGRWQSGAPLALSPQKDDSALGDDPQRSDNFAYADKDPNGYFTPLGAHIRRANPRDALEGGVDASIKTTHRHRLLRRGRAYGPAYSEAAADEPRGILFVTLNADIKRQFEFVQEVWINDAKFGGLYNDKDPIVGNQHGDGILNIQQPTIRQQIVGIPRFVTVKASGYFFMPGIRALRFIAGEQLSQKL